jgi:putative mRNA 3-end processing factor
MQLRFLGGAREVGRSALLIDETLLLDFGLLADTPPRYPVETPSPEAVVVSHGHLDHAGAVPALLSGRDRPEIHWTPPTSELARTLAEDTLKLHGTSPHCPFTREELLRVGEVEQRHGYGESFEAAGYEVTFFRAGHIPGSAHVLVSDSGRSTPGSQTQSGDDGETRLLYTGDFYIDTAPEEGNGLAGQRLVEGSTARPDADVVVCESTYSDVDHEPRGTVEERFVQSVETTLWEGGTVVVPAFAIGRTQELLLICAAHDIPCYVDGMGKGVTKMLQRYPEYVRDADALDQAKSHARFVTGRNGQRKRIADQPAAIVTTSGMLSGGPAMTYIPEIRANPMNKITMTGYQVEGTPGRELLERDSTEIDGRIMPVSAQVEQYDFSAHADHGGIRAFLDSYRDATVLVNHGDRCEAFAEELRGDGFEASAPTLGDAIDC